MKVIDVTGLRDPGNKSTVHIHEVIYFQGNVCPFGQKFMEGNVKGQVGNIPVPRPLHQRHLGTYQKRHVFFSL